MKKINKIFLVAFVLMGAMFQACETLELESLDDPNNITEGDPQFLLNRIQDRYRVAQVIFNDRSSEMTRIDQMSGNTYFDEYTATTMDAPWRDLYSTLLPDIDAIIAAQNENNDLRGHIAISRILQAHLMMQLVDHLGDIIPLEQANKPLEFPSPELSADKGAGTYAAALAILDEAIALINEDPSTSGIQDLYYGDLESAGADSDLTKWRKLANTLKMRAAITTSDYPTFNALVAGGDFISAEADDFQFSFGTDLAPVNTQHQDYQNDYTNTGANIYQSNWLMSLMDTSNDPRIRYYFYRQNACVPGAIDDCLDNGVEVLACSIQGAPSHLIGTPTEDIWCFLDNGYWGRLHGNERGTPPDGALRTAVGVYPAAGRFDDDSFENITLGQGGNGAGIEPIVLASYVDFWRAEAAFAQGDVTGAAMHLENGLTKSIAKVQPFSDLDGSADVAGFAPDGAAVTAFINGVVANFSGASGTPAEIMETRWNVLGEQYFVTLFGGGADAHNFYRRTGFPNTVSENIAAAPGNYPRTFLYPQAEVTANSNITQRTNNDDETFWNVGQPLPSAN